MTATDRLPTPASKEAFYAELHRFTLDFHRMEPEVELTVRDPDLDVEGFVVIWNTPKGEGGIAKGGTRVTPSVTLDEVRMLAQRMSLKNAAAGLPIGGAKSGIRGNPRSAGFKERFQSIARRFAWLFPENGGPFGGLGYDMGARPEFAEWFVEATGLPHRFTGKPAHLGGTDYDEEGIAGLGVAVAATAAIECRGEHVGGKRFAVQGLGAMGAGVVRYFCEEGARIAAVSDPLVGGSWTIHDDTDEATLEGLATAIAQRDMPDVRARLEACAAFQDGTDAVLYEDVDVLFPCAIQEVIHAGNLDRIQAPLISEGANSPCTPETRETLQERGVTVVPDFIANSGGIIAAGVEMERRHDDPIGEAKTRTRATITHNVQHVMEISERLGVSPYHAAHWVALARVFAG